MTKAEKTDEVLTYLVDCLLDAGVIYLRGCNSRGGFTTRLIIRDYQQGQAQSVIDEIMSPVTMQRLDYGLWEITA